MQGSAGHRVWMRASVGLLFGLALTWGLLQFGAAEPRVLQRLFLILLVPALLGLLMPPWRVRVDLRVLVLVLLGVYLLGQVAFQSTLEARGYLHLAVGWLALWLSLGMAVRGRTQSRFVLLILVLLGALEALYGLLQSLGGFDFIGDYFRNLGRIASGSLINRNHYAALLNMLLPLALGMLFADQALKRSDRVTRSESLAKTWIVLLGCSVMGVAVLLSQSRGGTLSLLMTLIFLALLLALSRRKRSHRGLTGAATGVLLFLVVGMGAAFGLEALVERFGKIDENLSRVEVYQDTVKMIGESPIVGVGPGMYQWRYRLHQTTQPNALYDHAHNDYLETAAEWGVPLALLLWGSAFWRFYRSSELALSAEDPRHQGLALGTAGALFSILVHSLVDFSLQIPAVLMVFACILALSWSLDFLKRPADPGHRGPGLQEMEELSGSSPAAMGTGLAIGLRVLVLVALLAAGYQTLQRTRADLAASPENGVSGLERAVDVDPQGPEHQYLLGMAYRDLPGVGDLTGAVHRLQQAVRLNPYAWRYWMELSRAQELMGGLVEAESSLRVAVKLSPGSGEYRWRLANLLLRLGKPEEGVGEIARAVDLEPQLAEPAAVLLLKFGVEAATVEGLLPKDRAALLRLMRSLILLVNRPATDSGVEVGAESLLESLWSRLLANAEPLTVAQGRSYVDFLLRSGRHQAARNKWLDLTRVNGISDSDYESGSNGVWNGDFDVDLLGAPLGWRVGQSDAFGGARGGKDADAALEIEFHGTDNLNFSHVSQHLILESETDYRLTASLRAEDLTTDQGVFLELISQDPHGLLGSSESILGSTDWIPIAMEFRMPEGGGLAILRLRRRPSQQIDNRLRGKVYVDAVRIEQVNP